jgi:solute carrier family 30 (zinc transporter), member 1
VLQPVRAHHEHRHTIAQLKGPGRDLGMLGVLIHVIGDAINNFGVIISAVVIWKSADPNRFYADPGVSLFIAFMILISSWPLVINSGSILLQSAPKGLEIADIKHDLEKVSKDPSSRFAEMADSQQPLTRQYEDSWDRISS